MKRQAALLIVLAMSACAPQVPDVSAARQQFERKYQSSLADGTLKIVDFRKTDGQRMTMFGVDHYELRYEATVEWPKGKTCSFFQRANPQLGCVPLGPGEQEKKTGRVMFSKSEAGWRATK